MSQWTSIAATEIMGFILITKEAVDNSTGAIMEKDQCFIATHNLFSMRESMPVSMKTYSHALNR